MSASSDNQTLPAKILVIEDETHIAEGIRLNLELAGYDVRLANNGKQGLEVYESYHPDLILLDIMMPVMDGHSVLKKVRESDKKIPVLILSAKNASVDKVKAFRSGVDDYLGKPFSLEELMLRVERLLLRSSWNEPISISDADSNSSGDIFEFGPHQIHLDSLKAITPSGEVELTEQEIKLLCFFRDNPDKAIKRSELLEKGWGYTEDINTRTLDNFMVRFRRYFEENPKKPKYFCSVRGVGYLFSPSGKGR